jgi:hypothetical protein
MGTKGVGQKRNARTKKIQEITNKLYKFNINQVVGGYKFCNPHNKSIHAELPFGLMRLPAIEII